MQRERRAALFAGSGQGCAVLRWGPAVVPAAQRDLRDAVGQQGALVNGDCLGLWHLGKRLGRDRLTTGGPMKRLLNWMRLDQQVGWPAKLRVVILTILLELAAGAAIGYGLAIWAGVVSLLIGALIGGFAFWAALVGAGLVLLGEIRAWHVFRLTVLLVATAITSQLWWILHFPWF